MSKHIIMLASIILGISTPIIVQAQENDLQVISGASELNNTQFKNLQVSGNLTFSNLSIEGMLNVAGSIKGTNLKCKKLQTTGSANINTLTAHDIKSTGSFNGKDIFVENNLTVTGNINVDNLNVSGNANIVGNVAITHGKINSINIASDYAVFRNSTINNITLDKTQKEFKLFGFTLYRSKPPIIELRDHTIVNGDIIFDTDGEVRLFDNSVVKGNTTRCQIIKN